MTRISFKKKPRKEGNQWHQFVGSKDVVYVGKDWCLQNDIDEAKVRTKERACYRECRTCGSCANSSRDASFPYEYDSNQKKLINCGSCEPYRYHDCNNGYMRNAYGDAEPFTEEQQALLKKTGGKPLM